MAPERVGSHAVPRDIHYSNQHDSGLITEGSVAETFAKVHHDSLRYDHHAGVWFIWTGAQWQKQETRLAYRWAHRLARDLAKETGSTRAIVAADKASFAAGVERIAQSDPVLAVTSKIWDTDPWLLGTPNGTVDLRTGEMRPADQRDHITRLTAVAPADQPECPLWLAFLDEATGGDQDLVGFLRRWCGYMLTGVTWEHCLLFVFGDGGNGKGVFMNTLYGIMGDYAVNAAMDTFIAASGDRHPTDMAMLAGARMVMTTEVDDGQVWAEARLKALTGGDPITARFMRRDFFSFVPVFKLIVSGNHKPQLRNVDAAARRRFNLAPFVHKPVHPDKMLAERLKAERPGILRWAIEGCLEWQRDGLRQPAAVRLATEDYFAAQDVFGSWAAERCIQDPTLQTRPGLLLTSFNRWADANGEARASRNRLRGWLQQQNKIRYKKVKGLDYVAGIGLTSDADAHRGCGAADD
jgi:putative DNA primase/helicase